MGAKQDQEFVIVVHGLSKDDSRPRAAAYAASSRDVAEKAAEKWNLRIGYVVDDAGRELAKEVPSGIQHPFNKVDAPTIKRETYDLLLKVLKAEPTVTPPSPVKIATQQSNPWETVQPGQTVLWSSDPSEGYFPAVVVSVSKDGASVTLRWRDYPKLPELKARKSALGLLKPGK